MGPSPGIDGRAQEFDAARSAAARLVAGGTPTTPVDLDAVVLRGRDQQRIAAEARAVAAYVERHSEESRRIDAVLSQAWLTAGQDPTRFAFLAADVRAHLVSVATVDHADEAVPSAVTRLRDDLSDYLATIEGLTAALPWS